MGNSDGWELRMGIGNRDWDRGFARRVLGGFLGMAQTA